jgi:hypothetical protein
MTPDIATRRRRLFRKRSITMTVSGIFVIAILLLTFPEMASAEETFVTIQKVNGNQMLVVRDEVGGEGGRGKGSMGAANGKGNGPMRGPGQRDGAAAASNALTVTVPATAKITSAMRERRTFEFRVLGEIPGGLRSEVFQRMKVPLKARIVTEDNRITEINVISGDTDINQSSISSSGQPIIAVKPKRPPMKKK